MRQEEASQLRPGITFCGEDDSGSYASGCAASQQEVEGKARPRVLLFLVLGVPAGGVRWLWLNLRILSGQPCFLACGNNCWPAKKSADLDGALIRSYQNVFAAVIKAKSGWHRAVRARTNLFRHDGSTRVSRAPHFHHASFQTQLDALSGSAGSGDRHFRSAKHLYLAAV